MSTVLSSILIWIWSILLIYFSVFVSLRCVTVTTKLYTCTPIEVHGVQHYPAWTRTNEYQHVYNYMLMRLDCIPPLQGQGYRPTHKYDSQYLHSVNTACIETDGVCRLSQKLCSSIQSYRLNRNICALHHQSTRKRTRRG